MANPTLIFDLDGTLVDTAPDLLGALNAVLLQNRRAAVDHSDLRHLVGHGARVMLDTAFRMTGEPADGEQLTGHVDAFIAHYRQHIADASKPFSGVVATLEKLQAGGSRLGVLTNKPQELTDQLLKALDLTPFFAAVYGAGRMSYTKPDARIFHDVVRDMGGNEPAIMVGDSITDVQTARAAGAKVIVMSYGYTPEPADRLGGDIVTDDFTQIPALAKRLIGA